MRSQSDQSVIPAEQPTPQGDQGFLHIGKQAASYLYGWALFLGNTEEAYRISQSAVRSAKKIKEYATEAILETPHFIGDCMSNDYAPKLFTYSGLLAISYLVPVFLANYAYSFLQKKPESNQENLPSSITWILQNGLMLLNCVLFLFSLLRKFQLQLHTTILLMKLPPEYRRMKTLHDIKKRLDANKMLDAETLVDSKAIRDIKNNVIESHQSPCLTQCNQLKFVEGDIRAILIFFIRELTVWIIKNIPYLFGLGNYAEWLFWGLGGYVQMSFSGLAMLEYRLSDQCEEHRNKKFNEHGEWFFMFGLLFQTTIFLSSVLIQLFSFIPKIINERYLGDTFLLSSITETFSAMPKTAYENYLASIVMLFLVGLSHYVPFPKPSEKSSGPFFDFGTRRLTNFLVAGFKEEFKSAINDDNKPVTADSTLNQILKLLDDCNLLINPKPELIKSKLLEIESPEATETKQDLPRTSLIKSGKAKLRAMLASRIIAHNKKSISPTNYYLNALIPFFVPNLFRNFSNDPIVSEYFPGLLISINGALDAMISSRQSALAIFEHTRMINAFCENRAVKWGAWFSGVSTLTDIFTYEFIMNKGPAYLDDFLYLYKKAAPKSYYLTAEKKVAILKKNILMIQKIIKELPPSSAQEIFKLLQDERFLDNLAILKSFLLDSLMANEIGLASLGYERVEVERNPLLDVSDCYFPGESSTSDFYKTKEKDQEERSFEERLCLFTTTEAIFPGDEEKSVAAGFHRVDEKCDTIPRSASAAECLWVEDKKTGSQLFKPASDTDSEDDFVGIPPGGSQDFREKFGAVPDTQPAQSSRLSFRGFR